MGHWHGIELAGLELRTDRLLLRPWRIEDAPEILAGVRDPAMREFTTLPDPYTLEDASQFVERATTAAREGTGVEAAVVDASDRLVGSVGLVLPRPGRAETGEVGYLVYPGAQGRGYAAEAAWAVAEWALQRGLRRVELRCAVQNLASAKTALRAGFRFEGVQRDGLRSGDGRVYDGALFARVAGDTGEAIAPNFVPLPAGGLTDGVVTLRAVQPDDAAAMAAEQNDALALAWSFTGTPLPLDALQRLANRAGLDWLVGTAAPISIVDVATGTVAGSLRLRLAGPPDIGGIGYGLDPAFRGKAYTTRALKLLIPWAFERAGFARLELGAKTGNIASQKAALAAGFEPDGVRAARLRNPDGTYSDEVRFALVNPANPEIA